MTGRTANMPVQHPFRFGVLGEYLRTRDELVELARRAEDGGYATFLIRDHFIEEPFGHQLAPIAALATVASMTDALRVGSLVFANDYRPPVMLAKEAATLDMLSDGRFELGLGTGFLQAEYEQAGISFDPPRERVDRFEEALCVLKGLFADSALTFSGRHYTVRALDGFPKPVQRPHPPILIGAAGRRMLAIAAREANIIGLLTTSTANGVLTDEPQLRLAETVARQVDWIRRAAGDRIDEIELSLVISVVVTDDRQRAAEQFARARGWQEIATAQVLDMPSVFIGSNDEIVELMWERRARYGFSYYVVSHRNLELLTPIVARLAGQKRR